MKTNKILIILISLSVINETQAAQLRQLGQRLGQFGQQLMTRGQALKEAAQPGLQAAKEAAQSGIQATRQSVAPLTDGLGSVGSELKQGIFGGWKQQIKDAIPTLRQGNRQLMGDTVESLGNRAQQFGINLQQTRNTFRQELADQFQPGRQMARNYMVENKSVQNLTDTLLAGDQALTNTARGFGPALRQQVQGAQAGLSSGLQSIRTKLGNVGSGLGNGLQNVGNSLTSTAQSYGSSLRNRLGGLKTQLSELSPFSWGARTPTRAHELALSEQLPSGTYNEIAPLALAEPALQGADTAALDAFYIDQLGGGYDSDITSRISGDYSGLQMSPSDLLAKIAEEQVILAEEQQKLDELAVVATKLAEKSVVYGPRTELGSQLLYGPDHHPTGILLPSDNDDTMPSSIVRPGDSQGSHPTSLVLAGNGQQATSLIVPNDPHFRLVHTEEDPGTGFRLKGNSYNPEADQLPEVDRQSRTLVPTEPAHVPFVPLGGSREYYDDIDLSPEASLTHHSDPVLVDSAPTVTLDRAASSAPVVKKAKKAKATSTLNDTQLKTLLDQRASYHFAPKDNVVTAYNEAQSYERALENLPHGVKVPNVDIAKELGNVRRFMKNNQQKFTETVMQQKTKK